jgi:hypothetical protein
MTSIASVNELLIFLAHLAIELLLAILLPSRLLAAMVTEFTLHWTRYFDTRERNKAGINRPYSQIYLNF